MFDPVAQIAVAALQSGRAGSASGNQSMAAPCLRITGVHRAKIVVRAGDIIHARGRQTVAKTIFANGTCGA